MNINDRGIALIKTFEGCKLTAYYDVKQVLTIGFGHIANVQIGDSITQDQADAFLRTDVQWAEHVVTQHVITDLTSNQFSALVSFVYNVGSGNFLKSTLFQDLNADNLDYAAQQFVAWDKSGGVVVSGLLRRRAAERDLFMTPDDAMERRATAPRLRHLVVINGHAARKSPPLTADF